MTGLTIVGARAYDPGLGRFLSADPVPLGAFPIGDAFAALGGLLKGADLLRSKIRILMPARAERSGLTVHSCGMRSRAAICWRHAGGSQCHSYAKRSAG